MFSNPWEDVSYENDRLHLALNHHAIVSIADGDGTITYDSVLQHTAEHLGADRAFIYQLLENGAQMAITNEWCASGVSSPCREGG